MQPYSILSLARNALTGHQRRQAAWRSPEPEPAYDVAIVGKSSLQKPPRARRRR
jgi:sarcosine oxidase subunit beta